ncbi:MAG: hypothetical protein GX833_10750 [Clostridium sp.]|nr:hypothetical protein [Clostridium sp.]
MDFKKSLEFIKLFRLGNEPWILNKARANKNPSKQKSKQTKSEQTKSEQTKSEQTKYQANKVESKFKNYKDKIIDPVSSLRIAIRGLFLAIFV